MQRSKQGTLQAAVELLRHQLPDTIAIYLFGSWGTEGMRSDSDLDLAFLTPRPVAPELVWEIAQELAVRLGIEVDLVDLRAQPTTMRAQVIHTGSRIWYDPSAFDAVEVFEDWTFKEYAYLSEARKDILRDIQLRGTIHGG